MDLLQAPAKNARLRRGKRKDIVKNGPKTNKKGNGNPTM